MYSENGSAGLAGSRHRVMLDLAVETADCVLPEPGRDRTGEDSWAKKSIPASEELTTAIKGDKHRLVWRCSGVTGYTLGRQQSKPAIVVDARYEKPTTRRRPRQAALWGFHWEAYDVCSPAGTRAFR